MVMAQEGGGKGRCPPPPWTRRASTSGRRQSLPIPEGSKDGNVGFPLPPEPQTVTLADLGLADQVAVSLPSPQAGCGAGWWGWLREEDFVFGFWDD